MRVSFTKNGRTECLRYLTSSSEMLRVPVPDNDKKIIIDFLLNVVSFEIVEHRILLPKDIDRKLISEVYIPIRSEWIMFAISPLELSYLDKVKSLL